MIQTATYACPCCQFKTLHELHGDEICPLCNWQDDGQTEAAADEVWGGPNVDLSLTRARLNFRDHWVIYDLGYDPRIGGSDSAAELSAKQVIVRALLALNSSEASSASDALWADVAAAESVLDAETARKIAEYEANFLRGDAI